MEIKNAWKKYNEEDLKKLEELNKSYRDFLAIDQHHDLTGINGERMYS